jgi:hypothetical protein
MVVLHEIGHADMGHTQGRPPFVNSTFYFDHGVLRCEAEAWAWALDMYPSEDKLNSITREWMWNTCLGSYYAGARRAGGRGGQRLGNGDRGYVAFTYDEPGDYFWEVADRFECESAEAAHAAYIKEAANADKRVLGTA